MYTGRKIVVRSISRSEAVKFEERNDGKWRAYKRIGRAAFKPRCVPALLLSTVLKYVSEYDVR